MMIACFQHLWNRRHPLSVALSLSAFFLMPGAAAAAGDLLAPTPLILKDGRIANVSVHVLPFSDGAADLSSTTGRTLQGLTAEVATDCFLTAQVIGHVGAGEVEGSDTLGAHRLARSRADAVQASLIERGLPAKSIASVWDWQFMVLEPRATLWVFRLTEGEDCEGKPLEGAPAPVVASAEPVEQRVAQGRGAPPPPVSPTPAPRSSAAPTTAAPSAAAPTATAAASPAPLTATPTTPAPLPAAPTPPAPTAAAPTPAAPATAAPATLAAVPADERPDDAAKPRAVPAPAPATPDEAAERPPVRPAVQAAAASTARAPVMTESRPAVAPGDAAAPVARVEPAGAEPRPQGVNPLGSLSITFANNSSYFPPGTGQQLESMVGKLPPGRYRVELVASVSGAASVAGARDAEEAARYNQWLANRRLDRVQSWFQLNVKDKDLIIQPEFKSGDDSRGVLVRITAAQTS